MAKLVLTVGATIILLLHTRPVASMARVAAEEALTSSDLRGLRLQLVGDAGAGVAVLLLLASVLSIYKPKGVTPYCGRNEREESHELSA